MGIVMFIVHAQIVFHNVYLHLIPFKPRPVYIAIIVAVQILLLIVIIKSRVNAVVGGRQQ